jgi:hypothetical protein
VPSWSHDGRWVDFSSGRSGSEQIWKALFGGGPARQVTSKGGWEAFEYPDGERLYYSRTGWDLGIWTVPADGGPEQVVPALNRLMPSRSMVLTAHGIYFVPRDDSKHANIEFCSFQTRRIRTILKAGREFVMNNPEIYCHRTGDFFWLPRWTIASTI